MVTAAQRANFMITDGQRTALDADPSITAGWAIGIELADYANWSVFRKKMATKAYSRIADTEPGSQEQQDAIDESNGASVIATNAHAAYVRITQKG